VQVDEKQSESLLTEGRLKALLESKSLALELHRAIAPPARKARQSALQIREDPTDDHAA